MFRIVGVIVFVLANVTIQTALAKDDTEFALNRVVLLHELGKYAAAESILKQILESNPRDMKGLIFMAKNQVLIGNESSAMVHLATAERAIANDDAATRLEMARVFTTLEKPGLAIKALDEVQVTPGGVHPYLELGIILARAEALAMRNEILPARRTLAKADKLISTKKLGHELSIFITRVRAQTVARIEEQAKNRAKATDILASMVRTSDSPMEQADLALRIGELLTIDGRVEKAKEVLRFARDRYAVLVGEENIKTQNAAKALAALTLQDGDIKEP